MDKDIYSLKLHEELFANDSTQVLRVPGGWIYKFTNYNSKSITTSFVPYINETRLMEFE